MVCGKEPISCIDNQYAHSWKQESGEACKMALPTYAWSFKSMEQGRRLRKQATCPNCGSVYSYLVETITSLSLDTIQPFQNVLPQHTVTLIYSKEHKKAVAIFDNVDKSYYKQHFVDDAGSLLKYARDYFRGQHYQIMSNIDMKQIPNVNVNRSFDKVVKLINWEVKSPNVVRQLIKVMLLDKAEDFGFKKGIVYYFMKAVDNANQKQVKEAVASLTTKQGFMKLKERLELAKGLL